MTVVEVEVEEGDMPKTGAPNLTITVLAASKLIFFFGSLLRGRKLSGRTLSNQSWYRCERIGVKHVCIPDLSISKYIKHNYKGYCNIFRPECVYWFTIRFSFAAVAVGSKCVFARFTRTHRKCSRELFFFILIGTGQLDTLFLHVCIIHSSTDPNSD